MSLKWEILPWNKLISIFLERKKKEKILNLFLITIMRCGCDNKEKRKYFFIL